MYVPPDTNFMPPCLYPVCMPPPYAQSIRTGSHNEDVLEGFWRCVEWCGKVFDGIVPSRPALGAACAHTRPHIAPPRAKQSPS